MRHGLGWLDGWCTNCSSGPVLNNIAKLIGTKAGNLNNLNLLKISMYKIYIVRQPSTHLLALLRIRVCNPHPTLEWRGRFYARVITSTIQRLRVLCCSSSVRLGPGSGSAVHTCVHRVSLVHCPVSSVHTRHCVQCVHSLVSLCQWRPLWPGLPPAGQRGGMTR